MKTRTTSKWIGAIAAALTLVMVSPAPHADAAREEADHPGVSAKKDSGWDIP